MYNHVVFISLCVFVCECMCGDCMCVCRHNIIHCRNILHDILYILS